MAMTTMTDVLIVRFTRKYSKSDLSMGNAIGVTLIANTTNFAGKQCATEQNIGERGQAWRPASRTLTAPQRKETQ